MKTSVNILTLVCPSMMSKYCLRTHLFLTYFPRWSSSWAFRKRINILPPISDMLKLSMQLFYIKILILVEKVDFHVGKSSGWGGGLLLWPNSHPKSLNLAKFSLGGECTLDQLKSKVPQSGQIFEFVGGRVGGQIQTWSPKSWPNFGRGGG